MSSLADVIEHRLITQLLATKVELKDLSHRHRRHPEAQKGGGHYALKISSPLFQDKSLIECHRMIYQALDGLIPTQLHALQIEITK